MSNHLQLGAIDIDKNRYVTPSNGIKGNSYKCIECDKKVILKSAISVNNQTKTYIFSNTALKLNELD